MGSKDQEDFLKTLTIWINLLLTGKDNPSLSPWHAGAPLTALKLGVYSVAVREVLHRLTSKDCCSAVRSQLVGVTGVMSFLQNFDLDSFPCKHPTK